VGLDLAPGPLSRITEVPVKVSRPGAYDVPDGLDLRALARSLDPQEPTAEALLAVRPGKAPSLTRRGRRPEPTAAAASDPAPDLTPDLAWTPEGYERWWVGYGSLPGMADEVAGHGADVLVVEPVDLRDAVVGRLRAVAATAGVR
jgi:proteasome accessory factor B